MPNMSQPNLVQDLRGHPDIYIVLLLLQGRDEEDKEDNVQDADGPVRGGAAGAGRRPRRKEGRRGAGMTLFNRQ